MYTTTQVEAMRGWIADCVWADMDEDDIGELTYTQITRGIARYYDGDIHQFLLDNKLITN
jgi:hypothetical protein